MVTVLHIQDSMVVHSLLPLCPATPFCCLIPWRPPWHYKVWEQLLSSHLAFCRKVATNPPHLGWKSYEACQTSTRGWDLLMSLLFFLNKSSGYELLSHVSFLWLIINEFQLDWPAKPRCLIKSLWNGDVNYALTVVAPINYSLGAFQTVEVDIPFLTKLLMARQN